MRLDKNSPIPAYYQILLDLERRIIQHEWKIGDAMPSEGELTKYYNVSRVTLRQAMNKLAEKNVIIRKRGKGTFLLHIPEPIEHDLSFPSEFKERIMHFGIELTAQVLSIEEIENSEIAKILEIDIKKTIVEVKRLFTSNGIPYSLNKSWLPTKYFSDLKEKGLIKNSLSQTLELRYNVRPIISNNWIEATEASLEISNYLNIEENDIIMYIKTIQKMKNEIPFEFSKTYWVRNKIRFQFSKYHAEDYTPEYDANG